MSRFFAGLLITFSILAFQVMPLAGAATFDVNCTSIKAQNESAVCNSRTSDDPLAGSDGLIIRIANIIAFVAGAAAIIMILVGSIQFITAGGDASNAKNARNTVLYALIGLAIVLLARSIVIFVVRHK